MLKLEDVLSPHFVTRITEGMKDNDGGICASTESSDRKWIRLEGQMYKAKYNIIYKIKIYNI